MKKRINQLVIGEIFWFSGGWKKVYKIDDTLLYYRYHESKGGNSDTIMKNSMMLVETKEISNDTPRETGIDRTVNSNQSGHYDKRILENINQ